MRYEYSHFLLAHSTKNTAQPQSFLVEKAKKGSRNESKRKQKNSPHAPPLFGGGGGANKTKEEIYSLGASTDESDAKPVTMG
jgi:hypothetical protein